MKSHWVLVLLMMLLGVFGELDSVLAQGWSKTSAPTATWVSVASSANGGFLVAVPDSGLIYDEIGGRRLPRPDLHFHEWRYRLAGNERPDEELASRCLLR